jgi:hypothetical protein
MTSKEDIYAKKTVRVVHVPRRPTTGAVSADGEGVMLKLSPQKKDRGGYHDQKD